MIPKPICPVDPTCTFWPKSQCDRPFNERDACWQCNQTVVKDSQKRLQAMAKAKDKALEALRQQHKHGAELFNNRYHSNDCKICKLIAELEEVST